MSLADKAVGLIDRDELVQLALSICNIDSAGTKEAAVAEFLCRWLQKEGFGVRRIGLLADRFNVIGKLPGSGGGYSLLFNSHMDTAVRSSDIWRVRDPDADIYHKAWIEGDELVGEGIVNDKGPMAAFLVAAKAVKLTKVPLKGDLLLTAVVAETSHEPCDDPPGVTVETHDLGARFLVTHGGIADFALIAEGTGFSPVSVEAGMAWYKITWVSDQPGFYTPYLPERTTTDKSPNMIVRAAVAVLALENWAAEYQKKHACSTTGGLVIPKAQIGAIKGGSATTVISSPQVCSIYLGAFIAPNQSPLDLKDEISEALKSAGVPATDIENYHFRPGHVAKNIQPLVEAVLRAHVATLGTQPSPPDPATSSMWRDINPFNEVGIPALTYGPRSSGHSYRRSFTIEALYQAACVYARTIVDICNQEKPNKGT